MSHKLAKLYTFLFLNYLGNESKADGLKDGTVNSKVQHKKEENMNKGNSSPDNDESFHMDVTTNSEEIYSLNQINDCLFADSLETGMYIHTPSII